MKPVITWIAIADGARARVLQQAGVGAPLTSVDALIMEQETADAKDLGTDRPGRSFSSGSDARSAMEPKSDPVAVREAEFVSDFAAALNKHSGKYDRLILIAAPRALGDIRKAMPKPVAQKVTAELAKDLTRIPNDQIASHLEDVLVV